MKRISILGSTGSIGTSTLQVIREHPELFDVVGLSAGHNIQLLYEQVKEFRPKIISVATKELAEQIKGMVDASVTVTYGEEGLVAVSTYDEANYIVSALVGFAGLIPTIAAIEANKDIGLANKETLVSAGHIVMDLVEKHQVQLYPIDSEHSAIFQSLQGSNRDDVDRIILTASGGSLRDLTREQLHNVSVKQALQHPNWSMGAKITIDSATMMNKGLEVIEAHWLFSLPYSHIDVVLHYESIIHSMVEFKDGSVIAQLGTPDMKVPIQYALTHPRRAPLQTERLSLAKIGTLHFKEVDVMRFPALRLAYEAGSKGGTYPTVLNAANEVFVEHILKEQFPLYRLEDGIEHVLNSHIPVYHPTLEDILVADRHAREAALERLQQML